MSCVAEKYDLNPRPPFDFYVIEIVELVDNDEEYKPIFDINRWTFRDLDSAQTAFDRLRTWSKTSFPTGHSEVPSVECKQVFDYFENPLRRVLLLGRYFSDKDENFDY